MNNINVYIIITTIFIGITLVLFSLIIAKIMINKEIDHRRSVKNKDLKVEDT